MNLTQITSADLKQIAKLLGKREALQARVAKIDAALDRFESGEPAAPAKGRPGRKPGRQAKATRPASGAVTAAIIELIKGAGKSGITVKEIAARLGVNYGRVFTWFSVTGKKVKGIKKVEPGKYAWTAASTPVARPGAAAKPEKAKGAGRVVSTGVIASDPGQPPDIRDQEESQAKTGIARCRFCGGRAIPGLDVCFSCDDSR